MRWLQWFRSGTRAGVEEPSSPLPKAVEGASPGITAIVDGLSHDREYSVLDLGQPSESTLEVYSRFARWVRFADITGAASPPASSAELAARLPEPERPYDLVFAWDAPDRTPPEGRRRLIDRVTEVAAPGARLHVVTAAPDSESLHPLRFTLVDVGRMRYEPTGPARDGWPRLVPSEVEKLLRPFRVERRFTLKGGMLEYVAGLQES